MASVLAIDIGGSTIRGVRADESGLQGEPWTDTTEAVDSAAALVDRLDGAYDDIDAIGVAAAAVVDRETTLTGTEDAKAFFEAVYAGDHVAREYYTRLKRINAAGIGTLSDLFSADVVKVGGGVALNHPDFVDYADDPHTLEPVDLGSYCLTSAPDVELTDFGVDLELYGAAAAAIERIRS